MNRISVEDLSYVHLVARGPERAAESIRMTIKGYLRHHEVDPDKFHETLTQAWLKAVWLFMQRAGATDNFEEFLARSEPLRDPRVMLTHYSRDVLFSDEARRRFVVPDQEPIPACVRAQAGALS